MSSIFLNFSRKVKIVGKSRKKAVCGLVITKKQSTSYLIYNFIFPIF